MVKAIGTKRGITIQFAVPAGSPSFPFSETIYESYLSPKEVFAFMGGLRNALFDWSKINGGKKIDGENPI